MPCKKLITLTGVFILFFAVSAKQQKKALPRRKHTSSLKTIVIDAGHGGKDGGAPGTYSNEKTVALAVALALQAKLKQQMPDIKVVMTRTTDTYPTLYQRASMANTVKGDLFISIHCNSAEPVTHNKLTCYSTETYKGTDGKKHTRKAPQYRTFKTPNPARGTETYVWAAHKNEDKMLTMRENAALFLDKSVSKDIADFNPNSPEQMILYSLKTQQYFGRSTNLAHAVEQEFKKAGRISREVRQRQVGIWVLQATAMPSILIETGYLSNKAEEDYLNSKNGQQIIASCIVKALKLYKYGLDNRNTALAGSNKAP